MPQRNFGHPKWNHEISPKYWPELIKKYFYGNYWNAVKNHQHISPSPWKNSAETGSKLLENPLKQTGKSVDEWNPLNSSVEIDQGLVEMN